MSDVVNTTALTTADRIEIQELLSRYSVAEDTGDADGAADLFVEDGTTVNPHGGATVGRDAIRAAAHKRWTNEANHTKVHWAANVLIEASEEGATAHSYNFIARADGTTAPEVESVVAKHDRLRREDGRWLFVERRISPIPRTPADAVGQ